MDRRPSIVVCGDLVRAIKRESAIAVAHWWGVSISTVWRWRIALGVKPFTEGTRALYGRWLPEKLDEEALQHQKEALRSPECLAKRAARLTGRPMPAKVKKALFRANKGRKHTEASRRNMSDAQKRRPPQEGVSWAAEETTLLGTKSDREVAKQTGRTPSSVYSRRRKLGIPNIFKRRPPSQAPPWTAKRDKLLGTMPDMQLAAKLRCTATVIFNRRRKLGVPPFGQVNP
jgi:hypothetical protein